MVNAAVHYLPNIVAGSLGNYIMPRVLDYLVLKSVRTIDLGPYKHKIDDALPLRKVRDDIIQGSEQRRRVASDEEEGLVGGRLLRCLLVS